MAQDPSIGRIVIYKSKVGEYVVPAIIVATQETLNPKGVETFRESDGARGVPPLSSPDHVHLIVLTPGIPAVGPNRRAEGEPRPGLGGANLAGTYQEWNVPLWEPRGMSMQQAAQPYGGHELIEAQPGGSWTWPVIR